MCGAATATKYMCWIRKPSKSRWVNSQGDGIQACCSGLSLLSKRFALRRHLNETLALIFSSTPSILVETSPPLECRRASTLLYALLVKFLTLGHWRFSLGTRCWEIFFLLSSWCVAFIHLKGATWGFCFEVLVTGRSSWDIFFCLLSPRKLPVPVFLRGVAQSRINSEKSQLQFYLTTSELAGLWSCLVVITVGNEDGDACKGNRATWGPIHAGCDAQHDASK